MNLVSTHTIRALWGGAIIAAALSLTACEKRKEQPTSEAVPVAAGVPADAFFMVAAPALDELVALAAHVEPVNIAPADDGDKPAWLACSPASCILSRATPATEVVRRETHWVIPDARGSLVVWGPTERTAVDAVVAAAREGKPPVIEDWKGWVLPGPLLARWQPTQPSARELLQRVIAQAGRIDFVLDLDETSLDAELRMQPRPGESVLIADLGAASAPLEGGAHLLAPQMLAVVRVAADPTQLWTLLRSTLTAERRKQFDALQTSLTEELHFDVQADVLGALTGQIAVFAYELEPTDEPYDLGDYFKLGATKEAVLLGVSDRDRIRRALDAWTQISQAKAIDGALRPQRTSGDELEWSWVVDGELRWSVVLSDDTLLVVDSSVALDRAEAFHEPDVDDARLAAQLEVRGAAAVVEGEQRSGLYVDVHRLREADPDTFRALPEHLESAAITVDHVGEDEVVRVRLTWRAAAK